MIIRPKGTYDIYGSEAKKWQYVNEVIDAFCQNYNYDFIRTPVFESSDLFHRDGDESDMVKKETYDFKDKGDRNITLRPEGTAGVVRSYIENKMYGDPEKPTKLYYNETMYRYERPGSGRDREFTQFGVEVLGSDDAYIDAEVISLPIRIFEALGFRNLKVNVNSLGDKESRKNYTDALIEYLKNHIDNMCEDCKRRYETNPLRILDCKVDGESDIIKNAPKITDYLNEESKKRFDQVLSYLDALDIEYVIDPNTVRGLDYYDHTVFEIVCDVKELGSANVVAAGGRYNNLVSQLGGPETPAVGFACGIGRIIFAMEKLGIEINDKKEMDVFIMYVSDTEKEHAIYLAQELRLNGFKVELENMGRSLKAQFKQADRLNSKFLIILNDEDLKNGEIQIKDNLTKEENKIAESEVVEYLDGNI
ncbi:MAG: histidine--tRNA ligase [Firmicutes bacterium]|nr:histidine--tRNA ligase [Bacillota bacterium]